MIDVGVQHCTWELIEFYPDKEHLLFEPVAEFHEGIKYNYANVRHSLAKCAVSDEDGEALIKVRADGGSSTVVSKESPDTRVVRKVRLDSWLSANQRPGPYLLKIDVDGHELAVLRGAAETLKNTSCVILEAPIWSFLKEATLLDAAGFRLWDIVDLCYYDRTVVVVDMIFLAGHLLSDHRLWPLDWAAFDQLRWHGLTGYLQRHDMSPA